MAAIAADSASEKRWGRVVSFNLSSGAGVLDKARKAASSTVQVSQRMLWSTGKAAWIAGTSLLILVAPLIIQMEKEAQVVDLEGGDLLGASAPAMPEPPTSLK
jgi:import receptor subunit TOM22